MIAAVATAERLAREARVRRVLGFGTYEVKGRGPDLLDLESAAIVVDIILDRQLDAMFESKRTAWTRL